FFISFELSEIMDGFKIRKGMNSNEINQIVEEVLNAMTLDEKIYLMSGHHFYKNMITDIGFGKRPYSGGGVERLKIPPFLFTDGPRGVIITGSTCFPVSMARGASWDLSLEEEVGDIIGKEVRAHNGNLFGGVCVNLLRHPAWGRAQETYGEDPFHVGSFGSALVRGVQKHNVMATVKHFIANSIECSRFKVDVRMDERTLREVYLPQFKMCIKEGCATVMSAYNKLRGEYCSHNEYLLREILKKDWRFEGFVHSDWMYGIHNTKKGIRGGLDVEMPRAKYYGKRLKKKVRKGQIAEDLIDDSVRRIIRTVLNFTTREDPQQYNHELVACDEHVKIARKVADKSMVLLKNKKDLLPLKLKEINSLGIIGSLANLKNTGDRGSSRVHQDIIITPLQGFKNFVKDKIKLLYDDGTKLKRAQDLAHSVDALIIVVGYTYKDEGEYIPQKIKSAGDRSSIRLRESDRELIKMVSKANDKSIVVLIGGSAIVMEEWKDNVSSILMAWYSGMEGGNSLADIIFGKVNPSGKLPFSIPKDPADLPFFDIKADSVEYGYYHGYSLFNKQNIEPAFPFGFGLSYTRYKYDNLTVDVLDESIVAKVDVTNIGDMKGEEIVQLYVGYENSKIDRPKKLLKGFEKVEILPKETETVIIKVKKDQLAFYNVDSKGWEIENIEYTIMVGPSSDTKELLSTRISIK
ncbi:MAG: beta-glucosidase, partial [Promethearchaeota archaeon]